MQRHSDLDPASWSLFVPSLRAATVLASLALAALAAALYVRYAIIQNTPLGLECEAGEESLICAVRLGFIFIFMSGIFGWTALIAALIQLWRPNVIALGIGLVAAAFGLVLYNTRLASLAIALLVLSLARRRREAR